MPKIVISCRRSDSDAIAGRIRDRLAGHFGDDSIVVAAGTGPRGRIAGELTGCDVLVVVVGPQWLGPGKDIRETSDPVRIAIETALQAGVPLIPALVGGAGMPAPSELPDNLLDFAFLNAAHIDAGAAFHADMDRLIRSLDRFLKGKDLRSAARTAPARRPLAEAAHRFVARSGLFRQQLKPSAWLAVAALSVLLLGVSVALWVLNIPTQPVEPSSQDAPRRVTTIKVTESSPGCASFRPALDEARIPEPGTALRTALTEATSAAFRCNSDSFDDNARTFATISLIVPLHVKGAACFQGDSRVLLPNWADHKAWADQQGSADLLLESLHRTLAQAIGCLTPEEQRLFYIDVARSFTVATTRDATHTFVNPTLKGRRIDRCLYSERECNEPAAFAWCRRFGFSRLAKWEWARVSPTIALGDASACTQGCGAFSTIVCAR
jgi:hypothetical protein